MSSPAKIRLSSQIYCYHQTLQIHSSFQTQPNMKLFPKIKQYLCFDTKYIINLIRWEKYNEQLQVQFRNYIKSGFKFYFWPASARLQYTVLQCLPRDSSAVHVQLVYSDQTLYTAHHYHLKRQINWRIKKQILQSMDRLLELINGFTIDQPTY